MSRPVWFPRAVLPVVGLAAALAAGCILRPASPRDRREKFDRSGLGDVLLRAQPTPMRRTGAIYGDAVELLGVDWSPDRPKPGDSVNVRFYYRVLDFADEDYKVFVHADDRTGRGERINGDHWPASGRYPTGVWRKGEVVQDSWTLNVPGYYPGDAIDLWTGFYQPGKDDRWPLINKTEVQHDGQNRVMAATIPIGR